MGMILNLGDRFHTCPEQSFTLKIEVEWVEGNADTKGNTYSIAFLHLTDNVKIELGRRDYDGCNG